MTADALFKESDHPRSPNGQFGSGGTVHVVTTASASDSEVRGVHDDDGAASAQRDEIEDDEGDDTAEHHEIELERSHDGPVDAVHIVHGPDGTGATSVYGAYDDYDTARGNAVANSMSAWDVSGPDRGDLDRDSGEEDEAAEAWNADHADEEGAILAKVDARGMIDRDADGALQWTQDGDDVDVGHDHMSEFDDHFDGMFPADETASYPGFDAANEHFEGTGEVENVFRVHRHAVT